MYHVCSPSTCQKVSSSHKASSSHTCFDQGEGGVSPRPAFYVGALRPTVGNAADTNAAFSVEYPLKQQQSGEAPAPND